MDCGQRSLASYLYIRAKGEGPKAGSIRTDTLMVTLCRPHFFSGLHHPLKFFGRNCSA